ncbi:hypothetical protein B0T22DRAFT_468801, partial [Podospora appendiculata]
MSFCYLGLAISLDAMSFAGSAKQFPGCMQWMTISVPPACLELQGHQGVAIWIPSFDFNGRLLCPVACNNTVGGSSVCKLPVGKV